MPEKHSPGQNPITNQQLNMKNILAAIALMLALNFSAIATTHTLPILQNTQDTDCYRGNSRVENCS